MKSRLAMAAALLGAASILGTSPAYGATTPRTQCAAEANYPAASTPVAFWSTEARCAIVPAGPGGTFGVENFGNKFPGEAAVYMGIVHLAIYDATVAVEGGFRPYATAVHDRGASPEAAIATAAYETLVGLPALGLVANRATLDTDHTAYLSAISEGPAKARGILVGRIVAAAVLARRAGDGLERNPSLADLNPPPPGPGVWQPNPTGAVLGLRLPGVRPLTLRAAAQFRPAGPSGLTTRQYADDLNQVEQLGRMDSTSRTPDQTTQAQFWTDHDIRQWNDGMLRLAAARRLGLASTARMLAMAHVAGGDAMIACFDAKYHYWFWRPYQAIHLADTDGNPNTAADVSWQPLGATPNFPEYPSAHACHSGAVVTALEAFFGTDRISLTLDSRATATVRDYSRLRDVVRDVNQARVLVGFHFLSSDQQGSTLGRTVGRYVVHRFVTPFG